MDDNNAEAFPPWVYDMVRTILREEPEFKNPDMSAPPRPVSQESQEGRDLAALIQTQDFGTQSQGEEEQMDQEEGSGDSDDSMFEKVPRGFVKEYDDLFQRVVGASDAGSDKTTISKLLEQELDGSPEREVVFEQDSLADLSDSEDGDMKLEEEEEERPVPSFISMSSSKRKSSSPKPAYSKRMAVSQPLPGGEELLPNPLYQGNRVDKGNSGKNQKKGGKKKEPLDVNKLDWAPILAKFPMAAEPTFSDSDDD